MKFELNIRHRPLMAESVEKCFEHFVSVIRQIQEPWGLARGRELSLPALGTELSATAQLRGKLGAGVKGRVTFGHRTQANLRDVSSHDDSLVIEFDARKVDWKQLAESVFPAYIHAMDAYIGHIYRGDQVLQEWRMLKEIATRVDKDLDGRDGFFRFGPMSFMDRELCRRSCKGMTPEQVLSKLTGTVPQVRLCNDGVFIVAAEQFPEQSEIIATDRLIRRCLGLSAWYDEG